MVSSGESAQLRCESRGGNPPATLRWFVDGEERKVAKNKDGREDGEGQRNETEVGSEHRWNAISVVNMKFDKVLKSP